MSRNFRQRAAPAPAPKKSRRKPSNATSESSDDDYNGIEDISSDEEDEPDVERAEEQAIMETLSPASIGGALASRSFEDEDEVPWEGFPDEGDQFPTNQFFEEHISRGAYSNLSEGDISPRRVSFDFGSDSSGGSEIGEVTDDMFPDLFVAQDALDPNFRRQIENTNRGDDEGSETYWDNASDEDLPEGAAPMTATSPEEEEYSDLSEDDYNDDTEDDEDYGRLPGQTGPRTIATRDLYSSASEEEMTITQRTPAPPSTLMTARKPQLAKWIHNLAEPFTVLDTDGKTIVMARRRDNELDSAANKDGNAADSPSQVQEASLLGNPGALMMSATFDFDFMHGLGGGDFVGPPEAFFAGNNSNSDYSATADNSSIADDFTHRELEDEFLDLGDDSDDADDDGDMMSPTTNAELSPSKFTTPKATTDTPQNTPSTLDPLIAHLTKTNVGAFRNNQNRHHQLTSNMVSAESLAFHSPQGPAPIRGVRSGRLGHTNKALTPQRKQRVHQPQPPMSAMSSPLGKRKASTESTGHQDSRRKF